MRLKQFTAKAMLVGGLGLTAVGLGMGTAIADPPSPPPVPAPPPVPGAPDVPAAPAVPAAPNAPPAPGPAMRPGQHSIP
jgi:hypothetical protein